MNQELNDNDQTAIWSPERINKWFTIGCFISIGLITGFCTYMGWI